MASILYTSGTTGNPKGCVCPHSYYVITGGRYARHNELTEDDVLSTCLPLFHMNAQTLSTASSLLTGRPLVLQDRFHATTFLSELRAERATVFNYIGAIPAILWSVEPSSADRDHDLRVGFGGGMPREIHGAFEERFGVLCVEGFGMTETGACMAVPLKGERQIGTGACGSPYVGVEASVIDGDGNDVPDGVSGELLIRGEGLFSGYHSANGVVDPTDYEGWFHTGDLARRDDSGFFFFIDRIKDMIRRAGENIAPKEVEGVMLEHPAVAEVAVVGAADPLRGQVVRAFVRLSEGFDESAELHEELRVHAAEHLAYFKVPEFIDVVDDFPRTPTARIQKHKLRDLPLPS